MTDLLNPAGKLQLRPMTNRNRGKEAQKVLIYGDPKTGKTQLAATLAQEFNLLYLDLENSSDTIYNNIPVEWQERIFLVKIRDTREVPIAAETVTQLFRKPALYHKICDFHGRIDCPACKKERPDEFQSISLSALDTSWVLVIDSGSQLAESIMSIIAKDNDGFSLDGKVGEMDRLERDDYGKQGNTLKAIGSAIQAAPFHVCVISHALDLATEKKPIEQIVPVWGTRNVSRSAAKYFNHVLYCKRQNNKHGVSSSTTDSSVFISSSSSNLSTAKGATLLDFFKGKTAPMEKSGHVSLIENVTASTQAAAIAQDQAQKGLGIENFLTKKT